jgi:hypothetical protein
MKQLVRRTEKAEKRFHAAVAEGRIDHTGYDAKKKRKQ